MRQITKLAVEKFFKGDNFSKTNTKVWSGYECSTQLVSRLLLHDNEIATRTEGRDTILIDTCGWISNTTKERLNGVLDYLGLERIQQNNFKWYLMGRKWNGNEVRIDIKNKTWEYNN
jgi:hypothetical protein